MGAKRVEQKASETALFAALRRALAYKAYQDEKFGPDYLAEYFLPPHFRFFIRFNKIRANTRDKLDGFLPGLTEYMIARTAHFDGLFVHALNDKIPQIVLLGAGYDTRAYRFADINAGTRIFELDIAPTQNRKRKCLKKTRVEIPPDVTFVPIDFNTESLADVLEKAGYDRKGKTLFIWEGVSYYLNVESVDATLAFVSHASHEDSVIAFDYTLSLTEENVRGYYGAEAFAQTMAAHHADETLMFSIEEGEIEAFLEQRYLVMVDHLDNREIEWRYLVDDSGSLIGPMTGHFRFVSASPRVTT